MAQASQKMTEIRFLLIRFGTLIAEPTILVPVMKIPLKFVSSLRWEMFYLTIRHQ